MIVLPVHPTYAQKANLDVLPTDTPVPTDTPTPTPTNTPTPTPTNTPTSTNTPTPTPTKVPPTPTPKPTKVPPTPTPVPTNTPSPIITVAPVITPTAGTTNIIITPTSNVVVPGGGNVPTQTAQPKNGNPTPTPPTNATPANPAATSTVAPIVPGDTTAPTNTTSGGGGKTSHASLSSMLLPISGIVGMVGVAIAALIGVEIRRRQRSLRRQQAQAVTPYPNTGFSAPPSQPPMQGINQQYSMQQYADMAGTVVMTPPPVSGMSPVSNAYSTEMEMQAQFEDMPPAMRASMMENEAAPPTSPPGWMQDLSPSDEFEQNDQVPQDDIQTYMHPQTSAPNLNEFNGPTQAYNYPASPQNQGIAPTGGNFPGFQPGDNRAQSVMMEQIAEQATRANIPTASGPYSAKTPGVTPTASGPQSANLPESTPLLTPPQPDPFLEAIMRQAQMGIFAMPDKDPGQQPS